MKAFWITTVLLMASITLRAEEQMPVIVEKTYGIVRDSSEFNRMDKKYQALAILTGSGPNALATSGISLGYHYTMNQLLIFEATGGGYANSFSFFSNGKSNTELAGRSYGFHFKHFTSNSFYYRVGLDYRNLTYKYSYGPNASSQYEEAGFKGESLAASFYIGNQWQWENFTLGCDWVGLSAPIYSQIKDEYKNPAAQLSNAYYDNKLNDYFDSFVKSIHSNGLRFYLGASF